jgi:hypothetical protein
MASVQVSAFFLGSVHEAETCWYDTARWHEWVDELADIIEVQGEWPGVSSRVVWQSGPAGRGRVSERVLAYAPLEGQTLQLEDDAITGEQTVTFEPAGDGVQVTLALSYRIRRRNLLTPLIDLLFVRRLMASSLQRTLTRFGAVLEGPREQDVG